MCKSCLQFTNLHVHNTYSSLDGMGQPEAFVNSAISLEHKALGITNHGNVSGLIAHYQACKAKGIKPILGMEAYFEPTFDKEEAQAQKRRGGWPHLTVFAKNMQGYQNLMRLSTESNQEENFFYKPITTLENLKRHSKGLVVLSGCILSKIARTFREGNLDGARGIIRTFKEVFEDNFFLEVMPPFIEDGPSDENVLFHKHQIAYNIFLIKEGKKLGIPVVMTTDAHYPQKDFWESYSIMRYMSQKKRPEEHYKFRYLMDADDVVDFWDMYMPHGYAPEQYVENTSLVADLCNVELDFGNAIPKIDWGVPSQDKLGRLAVRGLKALGKYTNEYKERLVYELDTIFTKGFEDYFLLCYRIIQKAKEMDIAVGFGRGSVCGSVLAYALGITKVDPLILDISFDRFLRPNKNTMPDIDMDFDNRGQHKVMDYLLNEFQGRSSRICTFGEYTSRNLFNDLAKHLEVKEEDLEVKEVVEGLVELHGAEYGKLTEDRRVSKLDKEYNGFIKHFCNIYGQIKFIGQHPAGIAVTDKNYDCYDSMMRIKGDLISSHDMVQLESIGLVKMDLLGLNNLAIVKDIEEVTGAQFTYDVLQDEEVYRNFRKGNTEGIFQFESYGAQHVINLVKPENILELMACNSLNRPGPLKRIDPDMTSTLEDYVNGKAYVVTDGEEGYLNKNTFWYEYCKDTYGAVIYQDQILKICREVAGLSWDDSDQIMKGLSKKNEAKRIKLRQTFIDGCRKTSKMRVKAAEEFYDKNTLYGFPKAHAAGYTIFAAYCMYLKLKHPLEFWWALLKNEGKEDSRKKYATKAVRDGVLLLPPHICGKMDYELVSTEAQLNMGSILGKDVKCIREGLINIKGLGDKTCSWLEDSRPWTSLEHLKEIINKGNKRKCTSANLTSLINAGATEFDFDKYIERATDYNKKLRAPQKRIYTNGKKK